MRVGVIVIFSLLSICAEAQIDSRLKDFFKRNRKGEYVKVELVKWLEHNKLPKQDVFDYALSSTEQDVDFAFYLFYLEVIIAKEKANKQDNVFFIINKGLKQLPEQKQYTLLNYLQEFPVNSFNEQSKSQLASIFINSETTHMGDLVRLCGKLQIHSLAPYLESLLLEDNIKPSLKWNIQLALGRMGYVEHVKNSLNKVQNIGINDQVVFYLIPDLLYLNNRLCFDFILQLILLNEENCTSTNPDNEVRINCAFRLIEMIAPHIKEFPVQLYDTGDIITDDYSKTLLEVRNWIIKYNYLYEINEL
ncbi:hypothetical protein [Labilibacter marinus]|uniref:hypothetical protein n=1 Tax=Labilibacter marinus TaxID=1477105 RepID=UPI00082B0D6F|nr:hypothetical protein [Labilibacter marinus]